MKQLSLLLAACLLITIAHAQQEGTYQSIRSGNWNDPANWQRYNGRAWATASTYPVKTDAAIIITSGINIQYNITEEIDQVHIDPGGTLTVVSGNFALVDGPGIDLHVAGTLQWNNGWAGNCTNWRIYSGGKVNVNCTIYGSACNTWDIDPGGVMNFQDASVTLNDVTINNSGEINFVPNFEGRYIQSNQNLVINNLATGRINAKTIYRFSLGGTGNEHIQVNNAGAIVVEDGANLPFYGTQGFTNTGTIAIGTNAIFHNFRTFNMNGGSLSGTGKIITQERWNTNIPTTIPAGLTLELNGNFLGGTDLLTVNGLLNVVAAVTSISNYPNTATPARVRIAPGANCNINSYSALRLYGATFTNDGTVNMRVVENNTAIDLVQSTFINNGLVRNYGTGTSYIHGTELPTVFTNNGTIEIAPAATLNTIEGATNVQLTNTSTGTIKGGGYIQMSPTFVNQGTIAPGNPNGIMTFNGGGQPFQPNGTFAVEINNNSGPGIGYDQLVRGSTGLTLAGKLVVTEQSAAVAAGDYTIIELYSGSITGNFSSIQLLPGYSIAVFTNKVVLTKVPLGKKIFRSRQSGAWETASTWETSTDELTWTQATYAPGQVDSGITIRSGHNVTASTPITVDELTIQQGGILRTGNVVLHDGPGDDLVCNGAWYISGSNVTADGTANIIVNGYTHIIRNSQPLDIYPTVQINPGGKFMTPVINTGGNYQFYRVDPLRFHAAVNNAGTMYISGNITLTNSTLSNAGTYAQLGYLITHEGNSNIINKGEWYWDARELTVGIANGGVPFLNEGLLTLIGSSANTSRYHFSFISLMNTGRLEVTGALNINNTNINPLTGTWATGASSAYAISTFNLDPVKVLIDSIASFTFSGPSAPTQLEFQLATRGYDRMVVEKNIALSGRLIVTELDNMPAGSLFPIIQAPGISGQFTSVSLPPGYRIEYTPLQIFVRKVATEECNGIDDDGDGEIDEGLPVQLWYRDMDGDGYGSTASAIQNCRAPGEGYVLQGGDCNDLEATINPNAAEVCDGIDNNCDGRIDEGCLTGKKIYQTRQSGQWSNTATWEYSFDKVNWLPATEIPTYNDSTITIRSGHQIERLSGSYTNRLDEIVVQQGALLTLGDLELGDEPGYDLIIDGTVHVISNYHFGGNDAEAAASILVNGRLSMLNGATAPIEFIAQVHIASTGVLTAFTRSEISFIGGLINNGKAFIECYAFDYTNDFINNGLMNTTTRNIRSTAGIGRRMENNGEWFMRFFTLGGAEFIEHQGRFVNNGTLHVQPLGDASKSKTFAPDAARITSRSIEFTRLENTGLILSTDTLISRIPLTGKVRPGAAAYYEVNDQFTPVQLSYDSLRNLKFTGTLQNATIEMELESTTHHDTLTVLGDLNLAGISLTVKEIANILPGASFTILKTEGALSGQFSNITLPAGYRLNYAYGSKQVTITKVVEICNGLDDDGDGEVDEGFIKTTFYRDADGDGFGNAAVTMQACAQTEGWVSVTGDCDDNNAAIRPGAAELCDGLDNNCDGRIDEGCNVQQRYYMDIDHDGYGRNEGSRLSDTPIPGWVTRGGDCADYDATVYPGAPELANGRDDNCNGQVDEGLPMTRYYMDVDRDGYGRNENSRLSAIPLTGYVLVNGDCADYDATVYPGAPELANGRDDNCNGQVDEGLPMTRYYMDVDRDGFGRNENSKLSAIPLAGHVLINGDCADYDATVYPGAPELANGRDDNCNGQVDEGLPMTRYYMDVDRDGFGRNENSRLSAIPLTGYVLVNGDCADYDATVYPGAPERINGRDDNCNGLVDEGIITTIGSGETKATSGSDKAAASDNLQVTVMPVPSYHQFTVIVQGSHAQEKVRIRVYDQAGRLIEGKDNLPASARLTIGSTYAKGYYTLEVVQGSSRKMIKLIKL
ncbi:MAG: hypothetical protein J7621_14645 [Niastella sp.]|nr:hypothetical protein [Niastella sp.]